MPPVPRLVSALTLLCAAAGGKAWAAPAAAEIFAPAGLINRPLALTADDMGRVLASGEDGRLLEWLDDSDNDGRADTAGPAAAGLPENSAGPGGAVLALGNGKIALCLEPRVWLLPAERGSPPLSAASGFCESPGPAGAGMHALVEGIDGWIYFTCGERGYHFRDPDRALRRSSSAGGVFRFRPEGGAPELFASGLRNPAGLTQDAEGNIWVMEGDDKVGSARLLKVTEGADFGWRGVSPEGLWGEESVESSPSALDGGVTVPVTASALIRGLTPGTLIAADRSSGGAGGVVELTPTAGGPPALRDLWRGGAVTDVTSAPDGVLYFTDWGEAVDSRALGRIWRLDASPDNSGPPQGPPDIAKLTAPGRQTGELAALLSDTRPRLRLRAQQALAARGFQASLLELRKTAREGSTPATRLHGLYGIAALVRQEPPLARELAAFLTDPSPAFSAAAARAYGESLRPGGPVPADLFLMLAGGSPSTQAAAALALARLSAPGLSGPLLECAAANHPADPPLRHALAAAMAAGIPARELAERARSHPSAEARLTAVLALRRLAAPELGAFMEDSDPLTAAEAARAVYDTPVPGAFPALAALLTHSVSGKTLPDATARRALAAAWRAGSAEDAERVAEFAAGGVASETPRALALHCLENWDRPPETDPLAARPFHSFPREPGNAHAAIRAVVRPLANQEGHPLAAEARRVSDLTGDPPPAAALLSVLKDPAAEPAARARAFRGLAAHSGVTADLCRELLPSAPPEVRMEAGPWLMRKDPAHAAALARTAFLSTSPEERRQVFRTLDRLPGNGNENEKLILELTRALAAGTLDNAIQVEALEALDRRDAEGSTPWRKSTELRNANLAQDIDPLAAWRVCLTGGDPVAGRRLFESSPNAKCSVCHSAGGEGGFSGPELDGVATRLDAAGLLRAMVHPSAEFAEEFRPAEGAPRVSAMPPAGALLTPRELRDLVAYLQTLKLP